MYGLGFTLLLVSVNVEHSCASISVIYIYIYIYIIGFMQLCKIIQKWFTSIEEGQQNFRIVLDDGHQSSSLQSLIN